MQVEVGLISGATRIGCCAEETALLRPPSSPRLPSPCSCPPAAIPFGALPLPSNACYVGEETVTAMR